MLESSESEEEDQQECDKIKKERERRRLQRIRKKRTNTDINKPENKVQEILTQNEQTALELHQIYKTNKKKWLDSYRGFPIN